MSSVQRDPDSTRERQYLLGEISEEERTEHERQYFASKDVLERVATVENDLIEQYLDDELTREERRRFESVYLSSPAHVRRVDMIRQLRRAAASNSARVADAAAHAPARPWRWKVPLAAAATAVLCIGTAVWLVRSNRSTPDSTTSASPPPSATATPATPRTTERVLAFSVSPVLTRSAGAARALTISDNTDVIRLELEGEPISSQIARVEIATVTGDQTWRERAVADPRPGVAARVDLQAMQLRPDDYIVTLYAQDAGGNERERYRYFLRVRAP